MKINVKNWDYWQVHKLISWHFDINGLIEAGLAIDKNTIVFGFIKNQISTGLNLPNGFYCQWSGQRPEVIGQNQ